MPHSSKDGRVISRQISLSESMADLGSPASALIATWLVVHADDQGRLCANPRRLKAQVFPMLDFVGLEEIEAALRDMERVGIVELYQDGDGTPLLQLLSWWKWQSGQRRSYPSQYSAPPGWQDQIHTWRDVPQTAADCRTLPEVDADCGNVPMVVVGGVGEVLGMEMVMVVGEGVVVPAAAVGDVYQTYETEIGVITPGVEAEIEAELAEGVPPGWLCDAFRESSANNKRSWRYAKAIVQRWRREGRGPPGASGPRMSAEEKARYLEQVRHHDGESADGPIQSGGREIGTGGGVDPP